MNTSSGSIPDFYEQSYQLNRGDVNQKGEPAKLGFLQVLMTGDGDFEKWQKEKGEDTRTSLRRSAVANWLTDTESGAGALLARVIVNRLWQHHFGKGLVASANDFGFQGEPPSHPELLEWLASELVNNGWRLSHLHKLIVLSNTYQMGDAPNPNNTRIDPKNRWLWRRPARRLEAEAIRDSALAASGALDRTMYGAGTLDLAMKRRSIYFQVKRSQLPPVMQLFDWPDTLTSLGERSVTTTPTQALVFINSREIRKLAEAFAASFVNVSDPVQAAFTRALGRDPELHEVTQSTEFIKAQTLARSGNRQAALADFCQALMGTNEFIYVE